MRTTTLLLGALALATPLAAQDSAATRSARITYLTSTTAYLDAGREDGLATGALLDVRRQGASVGALRVTDLSSHRAAGEIVRADQPLAVGDSAWYVPVAAPAEAQVAQAGDASAARRRGRHPDALRGRIGVRYLYSSAAGGARDLSQPALDVRLDGTNLGGTPLGLAVDVRARWTNTGGTGAVTTNDGVARVYQAALLVESAKSPVRAVVGRQLSPTIATVSFLDGALVEARGKSWAVGAIGGTEPDPVTFAWSKDITDVGGYVQLRSPVGAAKRWNATLGAVGSYTESRANREFAYLQGSYLDRNVSAFLAQELDYYRPWKVALGEKSSLSPTSTFASLRVRVSDGVSLSAGYDNRRNVRLFRDAVNPETVFDDSFRQGVWGGAFFSFARHLHLGLDARTSDGGTAGHADLYSVTMGATNLGRAGLSIRGRGTRYQNAVQDGWLGSLSVGVSPGSRLSLEVNGGLRSEHNAAADPATQQVTWVGGYADFSLLRSLYLMVSATHESGALEGSDQGYLSLTWRF